jgi:WD40 repeat protein
MLSTTQPGTRDQSSADAATGSFGEGAVFRSVHAVRVGYGVRVTPDGERIIAWSVDCIVHIWDLESGKELRHFDFRGGLPKTIGLGISSFSADGRRALTGSEDDIVRLCDIELGMWHLLDLGVNEGTVPVKDRASRAATFSADGRFALACGLDNYLRLYDVGSGKLIRRFLQEPAGFHGASFSPDGQRVLTPCARQDYAWLWDLPSGRNNYRVAGNPGGITMIRFSRMEDGPFLLAGMALSGYGGYPIDTCESDPGLKRA